MPTSSAHDFDFFFGRWQVQHHRLQARLVGSTDWQEFDGVCVTHPTLGGQGNVDDNLLNLPAGPYRALTMRSHDPATGSWAIWWLDARTPHSLDVPVIGHFEAGIGSFYADDHLNGQSIRVRFRWLDTQTETPRWEQAFSADGGESWELNWTMEFVRLAEPGGPGPGQPDPAAAAAAGPSSALSPRRPSRCT